MRLSFLLILNEHLVWTLTLNWHKISQILDSDGKICYPLLTKLAKVVLIIPYGNADVERIFSHMGLNKTKVRNSLGVDTLTALLRMQFNVKESCYGFK